MAEHLSEQMIQQFRQRRLSPQELLRLYDHIALCTLCRQNLSEPRQIDAAFDTLHSILPLTTTEEREHLQHEQFAAYVDGRLDEVDREIVESHLADCRQCAAEMREVRDLRTILSTYPQRPVAPLTSPAQWESIRAAFRLPAGQFVLRTAIPVAAAVLIVLSIGLPILNTTQSVTPKRGMNDPSQEIARLTQTVQETQRQYAVALKQSDRYRQQAQAESSLRTKLATEKELLAKQLALRSASAPHQLAQNLIQDGQGNLKWQVPVRKQDRSPVVAALTQGRLSLPDSVDALLSDHHVMMGGTHPDSLHLISPISTFIIDPRPTLRWESVRGAVRYRVTVATAAREPVRSVTLLKSGERWQVTVPTSDKSTNKTYATDAGTEWTLPREMPPLRSGTTYRWTVEAYDRPDADAEPIAGTQEAAKFAVLNERQRAAVLQAQSQYAGSPLLLGICYTSYGLLEAARREFDAQLRLNPHDKDAMRLLQVLDKKRAAPPTQ